MTPNPYWTRHMNATATQLLLSGSFLGAILSSTSLAQQTYSAEVQAEMARRVPVTIAMVDSLPVENAKAIILRRARVTPYDVILIRRGDANGDQLGAAVFTLLATRQVQGDTAKRDAVIKVNMLTPPAQWSRQEGNYPSRIASRLQVADARFIEGIGTVPARVIYLRTNAIKKMKVKADPSPDRKKADR